MKKVIVILLCVSTVVSFAQKTEINVIKNIKSLEAAQTVHVMSLPDAVKVDLYNVSPPNAKKEMVEQAQYDYEVNHGNLFSNRRNKSSNPPVLKGGFETSFRNYMHNDDDIAVSNQGMVMTMTSMEI